MTHYNNCKLTESCGMFLCDNKKCFKHEYNNLELICVENNCERKYEPICIICEKIGIHKGHKVEILHDFVTKKKTDLNIDLQINSMDQINSENNMKKIISNIDKLKNDYKIMSDLMMTNDDILFVNNFFDIKFNEVINEEYNDMESDDETSVANSTKVSDIIFDNSNCVINEMSEKIAKLEMENKELREKLDSLDDNINYKNKYNNLCAEVKKCSKSIFAYLFFNDVLKMF